MDIRKFSQQPVKPHLVTPPEMLNAQIPRPGDTIQTTAVRERLTSQLRRAAYGIGAFVVGWSAAALEVADGHKTIGEVAGFVATLALSVGGQAYAGAAETTAYLIQNGHTETFDQLLASDTAAPAAPQSAQPELPAAP